MYSGADRTNLPEPVEPGTDYHDVRVDYRLATGLRQEEDRTRRDRQDGQDHRQTRQDRNRDQR